MEAPRRREENASEGSQLDFDPAVRTQAMEYIQAQEGLRKSVLASDSVRDVRMRVLSHFNHPTELDLQPAPQLSEFQKAVLSEAVGRWNKQRIADSQ